METRDIAGQYICSNFRPDDRLAVVLIHKRTNVVTTRISSSNKIASEEYQAWLRYMNSRRNEVYLSMNTLTPEAQSRQKNDIAEIRHVYLDFDEKGIEAVKALRGRSDIPGRITSSPVHRGNFRSYGESKASARKRRRN
jgi:hypothetical protein